MSDYALGQSLHGGRDCELPSAASDREAVRLRVWRNVAHECRERHFVSRYIREWRQAAYPNSARECCRVRTGG